MRYTKNDYHYLYTSPKYGWVKVLRHNQLQKQPLCEYCLKQGSVRPANVVDHIHPHKGDHDIFKDPDNLQSLCKMHHDGRKKAEEFRGYCDDQDINGFYIDPRHPRNLLVRPKASVPKTDTGPEN